jgi:Tfp pilus assembly protein PilO
MKSMWLMLKEKQQVVICVLAVAMIGGFVVFRYLPLRKRTKAVEMEKIARRVTTDTILSQTDQIPSLNNELTKLQEEVGDYDVRVPRKKDLAAFMGHVTHLMNEHGLDEQNVEPGEEMDADGLKCNPVSIQCQGRLEQIFRFFASMQSSGRLVRIQNVRLKNDKDYSGRVAMEAETVIYHRPSKGRS